MSDQKIPTRLEEVTAGWLTEALVSTGVIANSRVESVDVQRLGGGFLGQYARLGILYDDDEDNAPGSLFVKLASRNRSLREFCVTAGLYERELRFYEDLGCKSGIRVPRRYYSSLSAETGEFVLILEDMASARSGSIVSSVSVDQARDILEGLARLHARWWGSQRLERFEWLRPLNELYKVMSGLYDGWLDQCLHKIEHRLTGNLNKIGDAVRANLEYIFDKLSAPPCTLVHGDFWISNILPIETSGDLFAVIDWQFVSRGRGALDAGYFLWSLSMEDRRNHDEELLRAYHSALTANGVQGYRFDQLMEDYRLSWLYSFVLFIWTIGDVDGSDEASLDVLTPMLDRIIKAIIDLDSLSLLPR